jgi:hypothetical protein
MFRASQSARSHSSLGRATDAAADSSRGALDRCWLSSTDFASGTIALPGLTASAVSEWAFLIEQYRSDPALNDTDGTSEPSTIRRSSS